MNPLWVGENSVDFSWQEITFYAIRVANADLDMVFLSKPGIGIERFPFPENPSYGIVCPLVGLLVDGMGHLDNRTIQFAQKQIRRISNPFIGWQRISRHFTYFNQQLVCFLQLFEIVGRGKVKAITKVDNGPDNSWSFNLGVFPF